MSEAYIVSALRTAGGRRGGRLAGWHPVDLAATLIDGLVARTKASPETVDDVILGCVGQVGEQAANVARNAVLASTKPSFVSGGPYRAEVHLQLRQNVSYGMDSSPKCVQIGT